MDIRDLAPVAILFVVAGVALAIGANVTSSVQNSMTAGSTAALAASNATAGIGEVAKWMPTIGLVIAAAIIIGVIFAAMAPKAGI